MENGIGKINVRWTWGSALLILSLWVVAADASIHSASSPIVADPVCEQSANVAYSIMIERMHGASKQELEEKLNRTALRMYLDSIQVGRILIRNMFLPANVGLVITARKARTTARSIYTECVRHAPR